MRFPFLVYTVSKVLMRFVPRENEYPQMNFPLLKQSIFYFVPDMQ